ncbi:hypothetical protein EDD22DRAFT_1016316 [Suillus occidentalis]|nr:hypothetical protein EDD22DRAFT_1016316 [Suillus occidentalis]
MSSSGKSMVYFALLVISDDNLTKDGASCAEEFASDVRLVFSNCITFNGADHEIAQADKRVEAVFDKQIKQLPEICHLLMNAAYTTHSCSRSIILSTKLPRLLRLRLRLHQLPPKKAAAAPVHRPSTSVPVIRRMAET